jgi:hypothetical protein
LARGRYCSRWRFRARHPRRQAGGARFLREITHANPFVHVEATHDLPKAKKFYSALFGWKLQDTPMPDSKPHDDNVGTARAAE